MTTSQAAPARTDFSYLDEAEFQGIYTEAGESGKIRFFVEGIKCAKCIRAIESLSESVSGLKDVRVEMAKGIVHVDFAPSLLRASAVANKIASLGFSVRPLLPGSEATTRSTLEDRRELIRLAVAGACAGNIMGFSLAIYFGGNGPWLPVFAWLSFALYLPVLVYVARPFYEGAWQSLKEARISIDLPMAVASVAGFVFSTVQLLRGGTDFYFDSMSGFLFLILLARFVQRRMQRQYLEISAPTDDLLRVRRISGDEWRWAPTANLKNGDRFQVEPGETVPAEAALVSNRAHLSQAWLTGESRPRVFLSGATVPAGAQVLGETATFAFLKPLAETDFGRTLENASRFALSKNRAISTADRWTQWLLGFVFTIALVFLAAYWFVSPEEAIRRSLALIVLACPCAMAFGTPLALAVSLKKAKNAGLIISDANVFEEIGKIRNIFFDKTGTLTDVDLSLAKDTDHVPAVFKKIILALENHSMHPIAFAFRKAFPGPGKLPPVAALRESPGVGVSGYVFGKAYSLQADPDKASELLSCVLMEDEKVIFRFSFEADLKPGVRKALNHLRDNGYGVELVSGDRTEFTHRIAADLNFYPAEVHGGLSPAEKAVLVGNKNNAMMIGDGVNDSAAMMSADVGVAVAGAVGPALQSAKIYLKGHDLTSLLRLFSISKDAIRLMRQNLALSLAYNSVGGAFALAGYIDPLAAAVLMPISSSIILLNTWRWGRE